MHTRVIKVLVTSSGVGVSLYDYRMLCTVHDLMVCEGS